MVRIHFMIEMIRWTGLAPWEFEFPFQGSLTSTFVTRLAGENELIRAGVKGKKKEKTWGVGKEAAKGGRPLYCRVLGKRCFL